MKATYKISEWFKGVYAGEIYLCHEDLEEVKDEDSKREGDLFTRDSPSLDEARGRVKRIMDSMGILDFKEVK